MNFKKQILSIHIVCIILLSFSNKLIAQESFREGFLILNSGDTLNGYIEYNGDGDSLQICRYKRESSTYRTFQSYLPSQIKSYQLKNFRVYQSTILPGNSDTLFADIVVSGSVSLLACYDHFYLRLSNANTIRLDSNFRQIVSESLNSCENITSKVDFVYYERNSLSRLVRYYNKCTNGYTEKIIKTSPIIKVSNWGPLVGSNYTFLKFTSPETQFNYITEASWEQNLEPLVGFFCNFNLPDALKRINLQATALYQKQKFNGTTENPIAGSDILNIELTNITTSIGIYQLLFERPKSYPFINFGFTPTFVINNNTRWQHLNNEGALITDQEALSIKKIIPGIYASIGCAYSIKPKHVVFGQLTFNKFADWHSKEETSGYLSGNITAINFMCGIVF